MWEELRRFSALDSKARGLFLRAFVALPMISESLRRRGFQATQATLRKRLPPGRPPEPPDHQRISTTVRMVRAAVRHGLGHPSCLQESMTIWWLLARQGISSELRIGVRKQGERFEAHAWVEREGVALNEPEARHTHYAAFEKDFPATPPETR
jgi:hypothetical protein